MEESINTYYFFMNTQTPRSTTSVRQAVNYAVDPRRSTASSAAACTPRSRSCRPACPATRSQALPRTRHGQGETLIAEANPADKDITVWTDDEPDRKGSASTTTTC